MERLVRDGTVTRLRIEALDVENLADAAAYLARLGGDTDPATLARALRWRLFDNPAARSHVEAGQLLRGNDGAVAGVHLSIPQRFVADGKVLHALCSSALFVDDSARLQGFVMFRRFLGQPAVDFCFASTCNTASAALWERVGGRAIDASQHELILPLNPQRVAASLVPRGIRRSVAVAAAAVGGGALSVARSWGRRGAKAEPTHDWERLAALAGRHADRSISSERTARFLAWRYQQNPAPTPYRVWLVRDRAGREGWLAAGPLFRAAAPDLRCWIVTDVVWPGGADVGPPLLAIAQHLSGTADMIAIRGSAAQRMRLPALVIVRRRFPQAPAWWHSRDASLSGLQLDLVPADGDVAP
jgi:hypothetical protein